MRGGEPRKECQWPNADGTCLRVPRVRRPNCEDQIYFFRRLRGAVSSKHVLSQRTQARACVLCRGYVFKIFAVVHTSPFFVCV